MKYALLFALAAAACLAVSCSDSSTAPAHYTVSISVDRAPLSVNATYTFTAVYSGGPAVVHARSVWNFGDTSKTLTYYSDHVQHAYTQAGTYTVEVELFDNDDGKRIGSAETEVEVQPYTKGLSVSPDTAYGTANGTPAEYTANYTGTPLPEITYFWDFGDGTGSKLFTTVTASYVYKSAGTYAVACILWDNIDAVARDTVHVTAVISN